MFVWKINGLENRVSRFARENNNNDNNNNDNNNNNNNNNKRVPNEL